MHSGLIELNPIFHSVFAFNPREGMHRCSTGTVMYDAGESKESTAAADTIGITAWIKELRVEPLTCRLIIQQLTGSAKRFTLTGKGDCEGPGRGMGFFPP